MNDIVIDTNVMRLFDAPADRRYKALFEWIVNFGYLALSQKLVVEYFGSGNRLLAVLINDLTNKKRINRIGSGLINNFTEDRHYKYTCNGEDILHARLVFLSRRKLLVTIDNRLETDVNGFRKVDGTKPQAWRYPPVDILVKG